MLNWIQEAMNSLFKKQPKTGVKLPEVKGEHWDQHFNPGVVTYSKFRARRLLHEKGKREAAIEEKRTNDKETGHNPWMD